MSEISKRTHVVPISKDIDRLKKALRDFAPDRVYIIYNSDPIQTHQQINEDLLEKARQLVDNESNCYEKDEVIERGVDFYRFSEALTEIYRILYKEKIAGNEVIVNTSGGTRQVAIASAYACSLSGNGKPIYYVAKEYDLKNDNVLSSKGVIESPFSVTPLHTGLLNLEKEIPTDEAKAELLLTISSEGRDSMKNILVKMDEIDKHVKDGQRDTRQKIIQKYHRHGRKLVEEGLLLKEDSQYALTETGNLISDLLQVQQEIEN